MHPILFSLGPVTLHTYGLLVASGFLAALWLLRRTLAARGLPAALADTAATTAIVAGLIGARLLYVALAFDMFRADPMGVFRFWEGGLVFFGGFAAALAALFVLTRRRGVRFLDLADVMAAPLLLGHALGRFGCFAAGCCFGRPFDGPWSVVFHDVAALASLHVSLHPTQLYEAAGNLALAALTFRVATRGARTGAAAALYLIGYGALRFAVEIFRGDDRGGAWFSLSPAQVLGVVCILAGIIMEIYARRTSKT